MIIIDTTGDWIRNVLGCLWERVRGRPTVFSESEERAIAPCQILEDFFRGEVEGACQGAELENTGVTVCRPGLKHMRDGEVDIYPSCLCVRKSAPFVAAPTTSQNVNSRSNVRTNASDN